VVCLRQDAVVTVIPTKRFGKEYDLIKVETTFQMEQPFPEGEVMFVPGKEVVPDAILQLLTENKFDFGPKLSKDVVEKVGDFSQEVQDPSRRDESRKDALLGYLVTYMEQIKLKSIGGNNYHISYEFKLYPDSEGNFEFRTTLPFAGLGEASNVDIQLIMVLPVGVKFDPVKTKGIAVNGTEIQEQPFTTQANRHILSFYYKADPDFCVSYKY
jgi:hypothetical protein